MSAQTLTEPMKALEHRYRQISGLKDRSQYVLWYGPLHHAPVLALGINPAGDPLYMQPDGIRDKRNPPGRRDAASASFFENSESSLVDSDWRENNICILLQDILNCDREGLRHTVVKTNLAFRRAPRGHMRTYHNMNVEQAMDEARPILDEILRIVLPKLVVLCGVKLEDFTGRYCMEAAVADKAERDTRINQVVYRPARVVLKSTGAEVIAVQVAHASQFSWTYERYNVGERIRKLVAL